MLLRCGSAGDGAPPDLVAPGLGALLSRSWPPAAPARGRRPEPPKAPLRGPSLPACREVPPLVLPTPTGGPPPRLWGSGAAPSPWPRGEAAPDEGEEEPCVFALEIGGGEAPDELSGELAADAGFQHDLAAIYSYSDGDCAGKGSDIGDHVTSSFVSAGHRSSPTSGAVPSLGASPVLLSALERLAATPECPRGLAGPGL